jgi:hypothetical protein
LAVEGGCGHGLKVIGPAGRFNAEMARAADSGGAGTLRPPARFSLRRHRIMAADNDFWSTS